MVRDVMGGSDGFVVLLPVKSPGAGKSRLATLGEEERAALAAGFATDVVRTCLDTPGVAEVVVITEDADFASTLTGTQVCADPGGGLNPALRHGAASVRRSHDGLDPVALCGDLPALSRDDLAAALTHAARHRGPCFVADAEGTGTTLYTAGYDDFDPRFGPGSAASHRSGGAVALPDPMPTLRRDVDDLTDLAAAVSLGVGPATARALAGISLPTA